MNYKTPQEAFWAGSFGNEYLQRNRGDHIIAANLALFGSVFQNTGHIESILELGSNIGLNCRAIRTLLPHASITAVEINETAAKACRETGCAEVHNVSILDFQPKQKWDLVFTKGVLIHLQPETLPAVYDLMYQASSRYLMVCEYYNPSPVTISYRGHEDRLFKRDFAGEILAKFSDLRLVSYGFKYRRDPNFPQDDLTWFLLEKRQSA